ncbi:hypothetical protein E4U03_07765 [Rothia nasimurium]|uniref:Hemolysin XhlA n=1 Tax=Rothia nasimurium TaxID=85336 RepID=A0A4Y9F2N6_9MICC|nr:hypothetical protein [Rothia nasimurium]MBF0808504.1 hypothetical protein [Rothia nasimurium]TFU21898.1 hypothetical protein E4U03_07765 [Rothia nasimurium]
METEVTLAEVYRGMQRIEKDLAEMRRDSIHRAELAALERNVQDLQDAQKWLQRTAIGALVLAVLDPIFRVFTG